jgi:hypothetical protein
MGAIVSEITDRWQGRMFKLYSGTTRKSFFRSERSPLQ